MAAPADHLHTVSDVAADLRGLGLSPVLVGGMALVILGSRRITRDFDFIVTEPGPLLARAVDIFYARGLELVSRLDDAGDVVATIGNARVAAARLRLDAPASASFYNRRTGLRIDLLFDFPIDAAALSSRARRMKVRSHVLNIASEEDLLALKKIAAAARSAPGDAEDIAFLQARLAEGR